MIYYIIIGMLFMGLIYQVGIWIFGWNDTSQNIIIRDPDQNDWLSELRGNSRDETLGEHWANLATKNRQALAEKAVDAAWEKNGY